MRRFHIKKHKKWGYVALVILLVIIIIKIFNPLFRNDSIDVSYIISSEDKNWDCVIVNIEGKLKYNLFCIDKIYFTGKIKFNTEEVVFDTFYPFVIYYPKLERRRKCTFYFISGNIATELADILGTDFVIGELDIFSKEIFFTYSDQYKSYDYWLFPND